VAQLIARHWQPVHDYAAICLATSAPIASMVTTAVFHQVFDRLTLGEPGVDLRPRLLVTVRDTVRQWAGDERTAGVLPDLESPAGGRGIRGAASLIPDNRRLAQRSFEGLAADARCLLWHTEVEAEPPAVPAALLGMDAETAAFTLEQAREQFRQGCVRAHRELAPTDDCRFYNRLLDVPIRRGGALLPDVQRHLADCRYCRDAAEQLGQVDRELDALLAEAVLGWGARRYLETRPGRAQDGTPPQDTGRHGGGRRADRRHRLLDRIPASGRRVPAGLRTPRALRTGAGLVSAGLLATVLGVSLWPHDNGGAAPAASTGVSGAHGTAPGTDSRSPSAGSPASPGTAGLPPTAGQTRLRNAAAGLCLDVRGEPVAGATARLAECSSAGTQQWSIGDDGLLRSAAAPGLCLDSHADAGVVVLGACAAADARRGPDVRYDLTARGELLPRWQEGLALTSTTPKADADIVVKARDHSTDQRWVTDSASARPGSLSVAGTHAPSARPAGRTDTTA
jgi:hypothetical protein